MSTETAHSSQTESPASSNAQDFSGSDDEVMDNFADGPNDDGTPMGLGGEKQKQSEPASTTLEADIANGTKQPGEEILPDNTAGGSKSVPDAGETGSDDTIPGSEKEPKTSDFPSALLQMAGLSDAAAAQAAGFQDSDALFAAIKWRSQLLTPGAQPGVQSSDLKGLYRPQGEQAPAQPVPTPPASELDDEFKPFELPEEKMDMLDEDLQDVIRQMNDHYQRRDQSLRSELESFALQQGQDEETQFDKAVQNLGDDWQDVFGEGSGRELANAGQSNPVAETNFNHRTRLFDAVQAVREVNAKQGYKPMPLEQEVQWALMQRYPDKFNQTISGNSKGSGKRRGVTASRPTQRNTPLKSQNTKVLSDVSAMLKKRHGYSLDMGQEEEFEGEI